MLLILCVGRIPFAFLEDIHHKFVKTYGRAIHSASAYAMNDEFSRVLSQQMDHFSNDPNADRLNRLKGEMSQVQCSNIIVFIHHCFFQTFLVFLFGRYLKFQDSRLIDSIFIIF